MLKKILLTLTFYASALTANEIDIAIIGGGVSGLYSAYRLNENNPSLKISVFEANSRLGGRVYSVEVPNSGGLVTEIGAMRFSMDSFALYNFITQTLQLPIEKANGFSDQHFHYVRGQRIEISDFHEHPEKIPYKLAANEQGKAPGEILSATIESLIPGFSEATKNADSLKKLLQNTSVADAHGTPKPLYQWKYSELIRSGLSQEAYQLLVDTSGFKDEMEANAYDVLVQTSSSDPGCFKITGGMQRMTEVLKDKITKQGVAIHPEHTLTAIHYDQKDSLFILKIADKTYYAKQVILTISPRALMALAPDSILFKDPIVSDLLKNSKRTSPVEKAIFVYDQPWWKEIGLSEGRSFTDMSIQQVYYWDETPTAATFIASFKDTPTTWSRNGDDFRNREIVPDDLKVPLSAVKEISKQVQQMHAPKELPKPHTILYADWNQPSVRGGFYCWNAGVKSWEIMPKLRKPYPDLNLHITGDNYGTSSGVAEALENVEIMLQQDFKLAPPPEAKRTH